MRRSPGLEADAGGQLEAAVFAFAADQADIDRRDPDVRGRCSDKVERGGHRITRQRCTGDV
jgi:hypothetical protein